MWPHNSKERSLYTTEKCDYFPLTFTLILGKHPLASNTVECPQIWAIFSSENLLTLQPNKAMLMRQFSLYIGEKEQHIKVYPANL